MSATRIFVSYVQAGDPQGAECARQLIADLQANGAEILTDSDAIPEDQLAQSISQKLLHCHYVVLIQTPQSLQSLRVQLVVNMALNLAAQHRIKGVVRLIAVAPRPDDEQPPWITPRAFDASRDYARARDKMLLDLGLLDLDNSFADVSFARVSSDEIHLLSGESQLASADKPAPGALFSHSDMPVPQPLARRRLLWVSLLLIVLIVLIPVFFLVSPFFFPGRPNAVSFPSRSTPARTHPLAQTSSSPTTSASSVATISLSPTPGATPTPSSSGVLTPTPVATPASSLPCQPRMIYSFEDGGMDGWRATGNIQSLQNSTAVGGYEGKHALEVVTLSMNTNDLPFVSVNPPTNQITSGELLCMALFAPQGTSSIVKVQLFVQDSKYIWQISPLTRIVPGRWNVLTFRITTINDPGLQVGVQFLTTPYNTPVTAYVDTVAWGG